MIKGSKEESIRTKQEEETKTASTSRQWGSFRNPRIVRVSRFFGGKDRHSKVCTVKGLRDRRIRLSVPTAIQLYDLQSRLGLNQPSKVVDWLLDATKDDIDKLPPLQMLPDSFSQFQPQTLMFDELGSSQPPFPSFFNSSSASTNDPTDRSSGSSRQGNKVINKGKQVEREQAALANRSEAEDGVGLNFFPLTNQSNFQGFAYNPFYGWDNSNATLSQFGHHGLPTQPDSNSAGHSLSLQPSSFALPSVSQFLLYPSATSIFPQYVTTFGESDPRQPNHFQLLSSGSHVLQNPLHPLMDSQGKPFEPSLDPNANVEESRPNKGKTPL